MIKGSRPESALLSSAILDFVENRLHKILRPAATDIGIGSKNCGNKALEGGSTPQGVGENSLFHNRRPSPPAFALPQPPGAGGSGRPRPRDVNAAKRHQSKPRGSVARPRSGSFPCEWKSLIVCGPRRSLLSCAIACCTKSLVVSFRGITPMQLCALE